MENKTFKHKTFNIEVELKNGYYQLINNDCKVNQIFRKRYDKSFIENTSDWEEVKPQFKQDEWLYRLGVGGVKAFARFGSIKDNILYSKEYYHINKDGVIYCNLNNSESSGNINEWVKATLEQIQEILSKVAEHKGYKKGKLLSDAEIIENEDFYYDEKFDGLRIKHQYLFIYHKGDWAKISEPNPKLTYEYICEKLKKDNRYVPCRLGENVQGFSFRISKNINSLIKLINVAIFLNGDTPQKDCEYYWFDNGNVLDWNFDEDENTGKIKFHSKQALLQSKEILGEDVIKQALNLI